MNDEQLLRYSRHIMLSDFDIAGQEALLNASVLIVGAGGLGCPAAMYLASSGVGRIYITDDDVVDVSNLQRQIAHGNNALGMLKVDSLKKVLENINPLIEITVLPTRLEKEALKELLSCIDVVVDCSDNFTTRFLLNTLCVEEKKPLVSGAAIRSEGQLAVFDLRDEHSACYRCLYHDTVRQDAVNCASNGVLAPLVGVIGSMQAAEAIKLIAAYGKPSSGKLMVLDIKQGEWQQLSIKKDHECPVCGKV
jgi:adenylyltransferase/sulfurtransferase